MTLPARAALPLLACLACSLPVSISTPADVAAARPQKLALLPIHPGPALAAADGRGGLAAKLVTARVQQALIEVGGYQLVPPADAERALGGPIDSASLSAIERIASRLHHLFGVDAIVVGTVHRFDARRGGPRAASRPASVGFGLELRQPDGSLLWRGMYDETQKSLTEDPGSFSRARARGFTWVTAESLAGYGAVELVRQMPGASGLR